MTDDPGYSEPSALPGEVYESSDLGPEIYPLHPNAMRLKRWQALVLALLMSLPYVGINLARGAPLRALVAIPVVLAFMLLSERYARAYLKRFACTLFPDGLRVTRGVFWRSEVFVPRARIQHTEVQTGPIARRFGIAKLTLFTAGTQLGKVEVEGLPQAAAMELRDRLLERHGRHDAV